MNTEIQEVLFADIKVGDAAEYSRTILQEDVIAFAKVSGDFNPVHVDEEFAKKSLFGQPIAHGFLVGSMFSSLLGTRLPGANTIYLGQDMKFTAPVKFGDVITARVEVLEKKEKGKILIMKTTCTNQEGVVVIDGQAIVKKVEKSS